MKCWIYLNAFIISKTLKHTKMLNEILLQIYLKVELHHLGFV